MMEMKNALEDLAALQNDETLTTEEKLEFVSDAIMWLQKLQSKLDKQLAEEEG